jgi:hypothetical protein
MKSHLQPRITFVFRHAQPLCVLCPSERDLSRQSRRFDAPRHHSSAPEYPLTPQRTNHKGVPATDQNRLRHIQIP